MIKSWKNTFELCRAYKNSLWDIELKFLVTVQWKNLPRASIFLSCSSMDLNDIFLIKMSITTFQNMVHFLCILNMKKILDVSKCEIFKFDEFKVTVHAKMEMPDFTLKSLVWSRYELEISIIISLKTDYFQLWVNYKTFLLQTNLKELYQNKTLLNLEKRQYLLHKRQCYGSGITIFACRVT